jgi:hypothetical protein
MPLLSVAADWFVSPDGTPSGLGSESAPWDLQTALNGLASVKPGDVIWVRGGIYRGSFISRLQGAEPSPIIVRAYRNDRVTLDAAGGATFGLNVLGVNTWYWGLELRNSSASMSAAGAGLNVSEGADGTYRGNRFINVVIHDTGGSQAITCYNGMTDFYGCIVFHARNGYGMYSHNKLGPPPRHKYVDNCIIFNNVGSSGGRGQQVQISSAGGAYLDNIRFNSNVVFNTMLNYGKIELAGSDSYMDNAVVSGNCFYGLLGIQMGRLTRDSVFSANYIINTPIALDVYGCDLATGPNFVVENNFYTGEFGTLCTNVTLRNNTRLSTATGFNTFVFDNAYQDGQDPKAAHVVVYCWDSGLETVPVDLSSVLAVGDRYEIRDVEHYYYEDDLDHPNPVAAGVYNGGSVDLPLLGSSAPYSRPVWHQNYTNATWPVNPAHSSKEFNVYAVLKGVEGVPAPSAEPPPLRRYKAYYEAEKAAITAPAFIANDTNASNGQFITSTNANSGAVTFELSVPAHGDYYVWGAVLAENSRQDSFFVTVNDASEDIYDVAERSWASVWQWTRVNGRAGSLVPQTVNPRVFTWTTNTTYRLQFRVRDANSKLDLICVSNDPSYIPTLDDALSQVEPPKVEPPSLPPAAARYVTNVIKMVLPQIHYVTNDVKIIVNPTNGLVIDVIVE